jgi:succinate dehydrogenase/fumarate reductase flavoprotein subunit
MPHFIDRAKPGVIAVTADGKRFTNEGSSYHDFVQAMTAACAGSEVFSYLICDHQTLRKYGLGAVAPFPLPISKHLRSGYLVKGSSIRELAGKIGVDPTQLEATVREVNLYAREGKDPFFGKGTKAYNRYQGDALNAPNPCLKPLEKAPFYAIKLVVGDLGTYAGLATNKFSQVLDKENAPIAGLYAVGNDIASIMGGNYPGAGITLGPALTFGHVAGCHLAGVATGSETPQSVEAATTSVDHDRVLAMGEVA